MRGNQLACSTYMRMCMGGDRLAGLRLRQQLDRLNSEDQDKLLRKLEVISNKLQSIEAEQRRKRENVRKAGGAR